MKHWWNCRPGRLALVLGACLLSLVGVGRSLALDPVIDSPMYHSPDIPVNQVEWVFPDKAIDLWLKALDRPEAEIKCQAAAAIVRAHREGVKGLEKTVGPLRVALDTIDQHPAVRLMTAEALIALDARDSAPSLLREAQSGGIEIRNLVEPALARWDYKPAREMWLQRLGEPATLARSLVLAIRCLGAVGEGQAADRLRERVLANGEPAPIRLEAARALALLRTEGLEKDAEALAADRSPRGKVARLAAASLLRRHRGDAAVRLLQRLALDEQPEVAAVALARLLEIDPNLVAAGLDRVLANPDPQVRSFGVDALRRLPTDQHLRLLGDRLDDLHPDVRGKARRALQELAGKTEFRDKVIAEGTRVLGTQQWRGLEHAAILLTLLDHKPAADRLVELLTFDRAEVLVAAAWGLRRLEVRQTLPRVVAYLRSEKGRARRKLAPAPVYDHQFSQLHQFLGAHKYAPAESVLREFIPRDRVEHPEARAAAIWALGLIREGKPEPDLVVRLEQRLNDVSSMPPEDFRVRRMCAVSFGRMGAKNPLPSLRRYWPGHSSDDVVNNACGWAIGRLTGEAVPPPETVRKMQQDWFLVPQG